MGIKILASMREEASEFREDPKKKMGDWWKSFKSRHHLLIERLVVYFKWLVGVTLVCILLFPFHGFFIFNTHPNTARDILSTLIQCEAAIVAIVISLTK
jgi:hypothetical protein